MKLEGGGLGWALRTSEAAPPREARHAGGKTLIGKRWKREVIVDCTSESTVLKDHESMIVGVGEEDRGGDAINECDTRKRKQV